MRRIIITMILLVLFTSSTMAYDFRNVNWGMSREEVIKNEGADYRNVKGDLLYDVELADYKFVLHYFFKNNKLYMTGYRLNQKLNNDELVNLYNFLADMLKEKYGAPIIIKDKYDEPGKHEVRWITEKHDIFLKPPNHLITIMYTSKEYAYLQNYQEPKEEKEIDKEKLKAQL